MASVSMSETLREQITKNYETSLENAYRTSYNVQPAIDALRHAFESNSTFKQAIALQKEWLALRPLLESTYDVTLSNAGYASYTNVFASNLVEPLESVGIVCNPNRPADQHLTPVDQWNTAYTYKDWNDKSVSKEASKNHVKGDTGVQLNDLEPFYMPYQSSVSYTQYRAGEHSPNATRAILVTDPKLCALLTPISDIEKKIKIDLNKFRDYLKHITTLKKFLTEMPGALDFVPKEYKDRMNKAVVKKPTGNRLTPEQVMPEELKTQMSEVILENKLLGDL